VSKWFDRPRRPLKVDAFLSAISGGGGGAAAAAALVSVLSHGTAAVSAAVARADRAVGGGGRLAGAFHDALAASLGAAAARGVAGALVLAATGGVVYVTVRARV